MINQNLGPLERLFSPSPKFFKILGHFLTALAAISFIISQLQTIITLPDWIILIGDKSILISGIVGKVVAMFTVDFTAKMKRDALPKDLK